MESTTMEGEKVAVAERNSTHDARLLDNSNGKASISHHHEQQQMEERVLLATIGSTVTSMDMYESAVIRDATFSSAPTLTGIGFPDLARLFPSFDVRQQQQQHQHGRSSVVAETGDVPQVLKLLRKVRSDLSTTVRHQQQQPQAETRQTLVLHMKEQMLLCFLKQVANVPQADLPVHRQREMALEQARSKRTVQSCENTKQKLKQQQQKLGSLDDSTTENGASSSYPTQSFAKALAQAKSHQRVPMMKRRKLEMIKNDDDDDDDNNDDVDKKKDKADLAERNMALKQLRQERLERRKRRRQEWFGEDNVDDSGSDASDSERELDMDENNEEYHSEMKQTAVVVDLVDSDDNQEGDANIEEESKQAEAPPVVICPLCQQSLDVGNGVDTDSLLSQHINECQQQQGRRTRSQRRSVVDIATPVETQKQQLASKKRKATFATATSTITPRKSIKKSPKTVKRQGTHTVQDATKKQSPLDDIEEWAYEDRIDDWVATGLLRMRHMKEQDTNEEPPGAEEYPGGLLVPAWMNNRLFPYQRAGLRWMWELHMQEAGGIMGDEGLGKTVQLSSFLGAMGASRKLKCALVISPATMLQHWLSELAIWAPGLRRVLIHQSGESDGTSRSLSVKLLRNLDSWLRKSRADRVNEPIDEEDITSMDHDTFCGTGYVIVTTYESIRKNTDMWIEHNWSYVVLDEAQKIRNPDADVTLACKRIRTPHRIAMSGTPIQNNLRELWSLFDFVFPGRLGTLPAFEQEFADPIRKGGYSNASPMQVQLAYRCALVLRDLIDPYLLRRQKKDVKEVSRMPGKTEQVLFCRLSKRQRALYEAYIKSDDVTRILKGASQLFAAITVLRKICNHPDLVCGSDEAAFQSFLSNGYTGVTDEIGDDDDDDGGVDAVEDDDQESFVTRAGKLEVLAKILPLWRKQGHRVLIFCQWKKMLNIIQRFTEIQGWKFGRLDGNTNVASRQKLVDTFNADESYFGMLCTTRTGGVGLNLTGANRIILYDPDWNPQTDAQARERAWRFGQEREVTVYRLITAGTIEEKIYHRQIFKTALTNKVLQDPRQRRLFTQKDLRDFFTLKADSGSVASGSDGITETSEITKGDGFVDPDEATPSSGLLEDNEETLRTVMKSEGLAGIFDHDFVEENHSKKSSTEREIEEQAKRVAKSAVKALKKSVSSQEAFAPTWTGSGETRPKLIALAATGSSNDGWQTKANYQPSFGKGETVGVMKTVGQSSSSLLASLRQRSVASEKPANGDSSRYVELLQRISTFVRRHKPTTDEILQEFDYIETGEAAIFRKLLNSVAKVSDGRWMLRET